MQPLNVAFFPLLLHSCHNTAVLPIIYPLKRLPVSCSNCNVAKAKKKKKLDGETAETQQCKIYQFTIITKFSKFYKYECLLETKNCIGLNRTESFHNKLSLNYILANVSRYASNHLIRERCTPPTYWVYQTFRSAGI